MRTKCRNGTVKPVPLQCGAAEGWSRQEIFAIMQYDMQAQPGILLESAGHLFTSSNIINRVNGQFKCRHSVRCMHKWDLVQVHTTSQASGTKRVWFTNIHWLCKIVQVATHNLVYYAFALSSVPWFVKNRPTTFKTRSLSPPSSKWQKWLPFGNVIQRTRGISSKYGSCAISCEVSNSPL